MGRSDKDTFPAFEFSFWTSYIRTHRELLQMLQAKFYEQMYCLVSGSCEAKSSGPHTDRH